MEKEIGYVSDNRHFLKIPLTKTNIKQMVPSKEKSEIELIKKDLYTNMQNYNHFEIMGMKFFRYQKRLFVAYYLRDFKKDKCCGYFINKDKEVKAFHLKNYDFENPENEDKGLLCRDVVDALYKSGKPNVKKYI